MKGASTAAFVKDRDRIKRLTETMQQANRHPRMGNLYRRYFDHWKSIGGGTFAVFSSISRWSNHGVWGMAEFYDSPPAEYPRAGCRSPAGQAQGQPSIYRSTIDGRFRGHRTAATAIFES